jgi:hypothetical protein
MITSGSRPFTAATSKFAYAQAFAGTNAHSRRSSRGSKHRLTRGLAALRRARRA